MFGGLTDKDCVRGIEEAFNVFTELIFIELLDTLVVMLAVVGEAVNSGLGGNGRRAALVNEGDGVLHSEVIDRGNVVESVHIGSPF